MSDAEFDRLARSIRPTMTTGNVRLDWFFLTQFDPSTGVWVHKHPDKAGLARVLSYLNTAPMISLTGMMGHGHGKRRL